MLAETICSAVSAAGLGIAAITAYRKRFLTATRIAAYSLVPVGLVMTGVVEWVSDIAFKPSVWIGFGLLAVAWLLFMTTRAVERRSGSTRKERKAARAAERGGAVAPGASSPSLTSGTGAAAGQAQAQDRPKKKQQAAAPGDDFSDIEAILKKHGI
ncbi:hypothetical protein PV394_34305 [Streptomyces sp. NE06-03E]|uniref:Cellulose synthase n=1 Tax=Streptomyces sp. gb1(2016) TaxID=1828321 RepID=A0A652KNJ7_9ACTN|nr:MULTISPECIES: hypothetical protein [unclassified Streptomyces]WSS60766.1 hypothetical protein OG284_05805 [Streptomyces sp. NBC_01177]WSS67811.1 hypothetical protein OG491_05635 [Streptomyces sp. NBC_01175]WSS74804.1 hypothetical protein OG414_05895 [Streptomyces sp. NBC_01174]MDX3060150.1 hypothetical protein [Streptomyces sp. NE06-03E]TXS25275.1 hypothetical protein EAO74_33800 [Streptomyces sp. gb1(2016)]